MELKETLLMPETEFPMRGNLPVRELEVQEFWEKEDIYKKLLEQRKNSTPFILHDGPPYANGAIHTGHAMNKIIKDFINRYRLMQGHKVQFVNGWDTHGLPVEHAVVTKKKIDRKSMSISEFREVCHEYAMSQVELQQGEFERLGMFTDWDTKYITLYPEFEAAQIRVFAKMVEKGYIYKGFKTIYWSPSSESALAEAEIEYQDVRSPSIYVAFKVEDGKGVLADDVEVVIWTTTPWTIPANLGISVGPDFEYVVVAVDGRKFLVAKALLEGLAPKFGWTEYEVVQEVMGNELEHITTKHPLFDRMSPLILGGHVTLDAGTGAVHTAPGHGEEDFEIGKKYNLGMLSPVNERGVMTAEAGQYEGMFYEKANKAVGEDLEACGALLKLEFVEHSYPHDWRTKKPVIYRATDQWFASVDQFKDDMISALDDITWGVPWGKVRLGNMLEGREDWAISRQRVWGVPIPIFYSEDEKPIFDQTLFAHVADLFAEFGSNVWYEREVKDLLPEGYTHPQSPNGIFTKENDIMDVWFDSGSSHQYMREKFGFDFPVDLYFEGSDQYRGWFNSSISTSTAMYGHSPYKMLLSHGMVLDDKGKKMSKSLGNIIEPKTIFRQYGADILRLWVSSVDFRADVAMSQDILKQISESYRKIRNSYRFLLGNLHEFDFENPVAIDELESIDQYILLKLQKFVNLANNKYDTYDFMDVYKGVLAFVTNDLSSFYLDYAKDILYIEAKDSLRRRQVQTVLMHVVEALTRVLAPILAHTEEEVWQVYRAMNPKYADVVSVFELIMPESREFTSSEAALMAEWDAILAVRQDVLKALEEARSSKIIGKSLEASVVIELADEKIMDIVKDDLNRLFIVSKAELGSHPDANEYQVSKVHVEEYKHDTCPRCWNRFEAQLLNEEGLCARCSEIVETYK